MADKPILFSGPMVRALLDGRKTQTRRVITTNIPERAKKAYPMHRKSHDWNWYSSENSMIGARLEKQPIPGDRFWVRESWSGNHVFRNTKPSERLDFIGNGVPHSRDEVFYWADGCPLDGDWEKPRPSIHMPRWASRIMLIVTDVRVQRLQEISETDVDAEGFGGDFPHDAFPEIFSPETSGDMFMHECFEVIWDNINGKTEGKRWTDNPWVVAYTFEVIKANIDQVAT